MTKSILKAAFAGLVTGFFFLVFIPFLLINSGVDFPEINHPFLQVLGVFFVFLGVVLFFYCFALFVFWGKGTPAPIEPPSELVIRSIYRYTRNPMYLGYFGIVLGEFFFFGNLLLFFYFLFIVLFVNLYLLFIEEPKLRKRFGSEYEDYIKKVPRWITLRKSFYMSL